jgi:hypothetical protein
LARGNPQWPGVLDLFRKPKISWSNFLADLKAQSKRRDKKMPRSDVYEIYEVKICLNMNSKTDNEDRSCDDIAFLYEIIVNFRFWQDTFTRHHHKKGIWHFTNST